LNGYFSGRRDVVLLRISEREVERRNHFGGALRPPRGVFCEHAGDQTFDRRRRLWPQREERRRFRGQLHLDHFAHRGAVERRLPAEHPVKNDSERIDVRTPVNTPAHSQLLRAGVMRRAHHGRNHRTGHCLSQRLSDAEVEHLDVIAAAGRIDEQDVPRFEVAVNDGFAVSLAESGGDLARDSRRATEAEPTLPQQLFVERATLQPLHDYVGDTFIGAPGVIHVNDVFMREPPGEFRLALEQLHHMLIAEGDVRLEDFEGDAAVYAGMVGVINGAHSSQSHQSVVSIFVVKSPAHQMIWVIQRQNRPVVRTQAFSRGESLLTSRTVFRGHRMRTVWDVRPLFNRKENGKWGMGNGESDLPKFTVKEDGAGDRTYA